jgi:hypothetical protein
LKETAQVAYPNPSLIRWFFGCAVPVFIGVRTLDLLGDASENRVGIKVSRNDVRRLMAWATGVALFRFLEPVAYRMIFRA